MNQVQTTGIILRRTEYGEADRILTVLTPDHGKLALIAKGVRKSASKLAGGIELFSVSSLSYIKGKGDMHTLSSTKLDTYYSHIVEDIDRTMLGYELLKRIHKATEDEPGREYFDLMVATFEGLNDAKLPLDAVETWFDAQLLKLAGHQPNLRRDSAGEPLVSDALYAFDSESMAFVISTEGRYNASHIKTMRLLFGVDSPEVLGQVRDLDQALPVCKQLIKTMLVAYIRL